MKKILITALSLFWITGLMAQTKEAEKYKKESEEMRKQVWAWEKPQFNIREVPAAFANASKVVLAHHTELTADSKSKLAFYGLGFGVKKELTITEIVRELVKVNDKSAVEEYSEFSFTQFEQTSGFISNDRATTYIGVRVIKPDGRMKEINADDIVLTKNGSAEKKAKVAIPDLTPGDVLDFFIATEMLMTNNYSERPYQIVLFDEAPVLSHTFHALLGKKYAVEYRSYNGAPELAVSKNEEEDIVIDVAKTNMPAFETNLWVAPARQLPFIRLNISLGAKGFASKHLGYNKPGQVFKDRSEDDIIDEKASNLSMTYYSNYWMKASRSYYNDIADAAKNYCKKKDQKFKELSDEEKAAMLYYAFRFDNLLNFNIGSLSEKINIGKNEMNGASFVYFAAMKSADLEPSIIVSNTKNGFRMNEIMSTDDLTSIAYLPSINKYLYIESIYDVPFAIPTHLDGISDTRSFTFDHPGAIMSMKKITGLAKVEQGPKIPRAQSTDHMHIEQVQMSLIADKPALKFVRKATLKGTYKSAIQQKLILYEDLYEAERKEFNVEKSLIEQLEDSRRGRKYVDEVISAFADERKLQKDRFTKEAADWFEQEVTNITDYKVENMGIRHTKPDFVYSSTFQISGMVKKAGNNYIIEIGKIQGEPLSIKKEQRERNVDIYMGYPRGIEYHIEFEIPQGYTAEGIAALNKNITNETGYFVVEASATDKMVSIHVKKHYLNSFEPVANWKKLTAFIDAATEWTNAKFLLKKK